MNDADLLEISGSAESDFNKNEEYEEEEYVNNSPIMQETTGQMAEQFENVNIDNDSLVVIEVRKLVNAARDEMNSKIECLLQEMRSIKMLIGGESPYKQFKKIKSTNMLNSFVESMKADEKKMSLIQHLKNLPDSTKSKNVNHGKIATMIEYLFVPKFIQKRLKWGEMNGQEKSHRTIYLVNYPIFLEIGSYLCVGSSAKEIRNSFQIYFKHRAKKLSPE